MITAQDDVRREAIAEYRIVGEPPEPDIEALARLASLICGVPKAVINIIDDRLQHQIAAVGITPMVCAREDSLCSTVVEQNAALIVSDMLIDARFAHHAFVTGAVAAMRFYASTPLVTPVGIAIGTLCLFDDAPHELDLSQRDSLALLAGQIVDALELRRMTRELKDSNERLERFASQVSHDLVNPLMAVTGFIETAAENPDVTEIAPVVDALARADAAAGRMATMLTNLLNYARVGRAVPAPECVELAEVISSAIDDLDAVIRDSHAEISVYAPARIYGDPSVLGALLQNVIANAVKFTYGGGTQPRITVSAQDVVGAIRITVDDNGPGIAADQRDRVFGLMERGDADADVPGLGIGLATCRQIVEAHNGRIGVSDSPLGGARIWILLPQKG